MEIKFEMGNVLLQHIVPDPDHCSNSNPTAIPVSRPGLIIHSSSVSSSSDLVLDAFVFLRRFSLSLSLPSTSFSCLSQTVLAVSATTSGKMMSKTSLYQSTAWPEMPCLMF